MPNGIAHCPPLEKLWRKLESCFSRIQHLSKVRLISLPYTTLIGLNFRVDNKELTEDLIRVGRSWRSHHINIFCYASDILVQWEERAWWLKSVKPKTKSFEFWTKSFTSRSEKNNPAKDSEPSVGSVWQFSFGELRSVQYAHTYKITGHVCHCHYHFKGESPSPSSSLHCTASSSSWASSSWWESS